MDDGAEGLRQHHRQAALHQLVAPPAPRLPPARNRRHQRIHAQHQVGALLEGHRGVQGLLQRAIDVMPAVDLHRREHARQRRAGLHRGGDRHVLGPGAPNTTDSPESRSVATRNRRRFSSRKSLLRPGAVNTLPEEAVDAGAVEDAGRDGLRQALEGLEEALAPGIGQVVPDRGQQERRHRQGAHRILAEGRLEQQFRLEGLFRGVALDEHVAHALGRQPVGQSGGDEAAGAHADIHVELVEIDALQRLGQRQQRAEFVDGPQRPAAGKARRGKRAIGDFGRPAAGRSSFPRSVSPAGSARPTRAQLFIA
jgi:hypothetical protein